MKMLSILFSLTILSPTMLMAASGDGPSNSSITPANTNEECVIRVIEFFGVKEGTTKELLGMKNGQKCGLVVKSEKFISGLNHKESNLLKLDFVVESDGNELFPEIRSIISSNEDMNKYTISSCDVVNNTLKLEYTSKEIAGWHKTHKIKLNVSTKDVSMSIKRGTFLSGVSKQELNCQL